MVPAWGEGDEDESGLLPTALFLAPRLLPSSGIFSNLNSSGSTLSDPFRGHSVSMSTTLAGLEDAKELDGASTYDLVITCVVKLHPITRPSVNGGI